MSFNPANPIQDLLVFGEFGDVNPSITDSSTYTFLSPDTMSEIFEHEMEGCFLYSRHFNPINRYLSQALAGMENTESAHVTASGMGAISTTIMQICKAGDEIVSSRTIYGGTYALFKNFLPRFGIKVSFVDITNLEAVESAINDRTRVIYTETMSNPLLEVADLPALAGMAHSRDMLLVVDNTFTPMIVTPSKYGADVVIHSLTKYINGTSDTVAGAICGSKDFINGLLDVNQGACMLLGPVLDSVRAASILKNLHSLHIRMKQHSANGLLLSKMLQEWGLKVHYPGLPNHPNHELFSQLANEGFGHSGMLTIDVGTVEKANRLVTVMQEEKVGYLAVSLGYFKTLFSAPGRSTSSEIPKEEQDEMGLTDGLIRFSVGLDDDMERSAERIKKSLEICEIL